MEKIELLKRSELFRDLDDDQLAVIQDLCTSEVFEPGDLICKQSRIEDRVYVIEEGLVGIILEVGPMAQRQVQAVSNFETFGWSAIIEPHTCTASVKAIETTKVLAFEGQKLDDLFAERPEIGFKVAKAVARVVATRLRQSYVQLLGVTAQD
ncbi:MAG: cyclic nucleotide-binding domain-containing protein [Dehalococcoidia bacterium]